MPRQAILGIIAIAITLSGMGCAPTPAASPAAPVADAAMKDPMGTYKPFSDASIKQPPKKDMEFGGGQKLSIQYDGSKSAVGDSLFYRVYYVDKTGDVRRLTEDQFEGKTKGTFMSANNLFGKEANGRQGFLEIYVIANSKLKTVDGKLKPVGKEIKLGMYPIKIQSE